MMPMIKSVKGAKDWSGKELGVQGGGGKDMKLGMDIAKLWT